ncbi:EAL domain-containing protein (putative c-di-GMP-specific phosphodiesterase class I) [Paraburkholderia sp. WSM4175]|uniref:EAL domain-containing protein n=1 Tax=Paraburkholderia sp. WSM4175 TaxID=2991072 RepID=UPI003D1F9915
MGEGRLSGFESLLRWKNPSRGVLTPISFIDLVEDSPLTRSFTDFIVTEAVRTLANWTVRGYDTLSLAVNLPAAEIGRPGLANTLSTLLCNCSIDTSRLQIYISAPIADEQIDKLVARHGLVH